VTAASRVETNDNAELQFQLNLGGHNGILAGDAGKHAGVLVVDSLVVDEIESGYEMEFRAAEFGLEGSEITPRMLWVVCRGDSP